MFKPLDPMSQCFGVQIAADNGHDGISALNKFFWISCRQAWDWFMRSSQMIAAQSDEGEDDAIRTLRFEHDPCLHLEPM